ncbi:hypothetical protein QQZ08_002759 [Neonectria magnoliae]|uniref:Inositolphosphotransferase Aur1/Ipt1 domain-containing protein n=1 Tax=Neonectria magnoliae TaxID=2732573 RepID=A0ABR1ICF7_9HYPO
MAEPVPAVPDLGKPQFQHHAAFEPVIVVGIMVASCYVTRRRNYPLKPPSNQDQGLLGRPEHRDDGDSLSDDYEEQEMLSRYPVSSASATHPSKKRNCCGTVVYTPNTSRYANYRHSRFIQKFPFLVEMFYWAINLLFYVSVKAGSELIFATEGIWKTAETHAVAVLDFEHKGFFSFLFPLREVDVQMFFRTKHQDMLTVLNRGYSLIHIPVTVSFLAWYYYAAPTHAQFAAARRMMSLTNFVSFAVFTTYPCMPPRLLPEEFGFFDTVRREDAESIWASGKFFNQLAAFPSLHFGYSFCIGTVLMYHSGLFRRRLGPREKRMSKFRQFFFAALSIVYPSTVLLIIVSTANHYWLDAMAATGVVAISWLCNRGLLLLLPLEDFFLWSVKLEKPIPTTGTRG